MSSVRRALLDFGFSAARNFLSAFSTESFGISAMAHPYIQYPIDEHQDNRSFASRKSGTKPSARMT